MIAQKATRDGSGNKGLVVSACYQSLQHCFFEVELLIAPFPCQATSFSKGNTILETRRPLGLVSDRR